MTDSETGRVDNYARRLRGLVKSRRARLASFLYVSAVIGAAFLILSPLPVLASPPVPVITAPVLVASNVASGVSVDASDTCVTAFSCSPYTQMAQWDSLASAWVVIYPTTAWTKGASAPAVTFDMVWSQDALTWSRPIAVYTDGGAVSDGCTYANGISSTYSWSLGNINTGYERLVFIFACQLNAASAGWIWAFVDISNLNAPVIDHADTYQVATTTSGYYITQVALTMPALAFETVWYQIFESGYYPVFFSSIQNYATNSAPVSIVGTMSISVVGGYAAGIGFAGGGPATPYIMNSFTPNSISLSPSMQNGSYTLDPGTVFTYGGSQRYAFTGNTAYGGGACTVGIFTTANNVWSYQRMTGNSCGGASGYTVWTVSDGSSNVWWLDYAHDLFSYSSDGATTFSAPATAAVGFVTGQVPLSFSTIIANSAAGESLQALIVTVGVTGGNTNGNLYVAVVSTAPGVTTSVIQTIGACPLATPGHGTYLVNNTQYWYAGNALGGEVVNTIQFQVSQVKGTAAQTLQVLLYVSTGQTPTIGSPALRVYASLPNYVISAGTKNQTVTIQISVPLNAPVLQALPFNYWAVVVVGNDHIALVNSGLSGLTTQAGNPSGQAQPNSFSAVGSASGLKLAFCAMGQYQSIFTVTSITAGSSTTLVTSTLTVTQINQQQAINSFVGYVLALVVMLVPTIIMATLLGGVSHSGSGTIIGAMIGFAMGTGLGYYAGLVPAGWVFIAIIALIAMIIFAVMSSRGGVG